MQIDLEPSAVTGKARLVTTTMVLPLTGGPSLSWLSRVAEFHGRNRHKDRTGSGEHIVEHVAVYVGQTEVAAAVAVGQVPVVHA